MFKFLKEKLGNWAKKISKEAQPEKEEVQPEKIKKETKKLQKEKPEQEKEEKTIDLPMKFSVASQKFEPDLEKLKEVEVELKERSKEEPKPGTKSFFQKITGKIQKVKISEKEFEVYSEELKMLLLENNVAFEVAEKIIKELEDKIAGKEFLRKEIESEVKEALKEIIENILPEPFSVAEKIREKAKEQEKEPYVILFMGVNGTGKTTTIAKIATYLKKQGISCVLAAADTFRAASIEQLKKHGERIDVHVIAHEYNSDPASVGFDAIKYAKKNFINVVLIDTAGRMHTSKNLLKEMEKISRVCRPDLKLFIGESITGNDSVEQAKSFNWNIGIDGIILTKAEVDEKGGTALSVGYVTKKPILYLGTGQDYDEIEVFDKKKFIKDLGL